MTRQPLSFDAYDEAISPRPETTEFDRVVDSALSRRGFLGVMTFGLGAFLSGTSALGRAAQAATDRFGFTQIAASTADTITLPEGFEWKPVVLWGDPLFADAPAFDPETRGTAATQARAFGDNNDGMSIFYRDGRHVMAVNNEYTNVATLWRAPEAATDDDVEKGMMAHGVSVFEVRETGTGWEIVKDSPLNRRITPRTEMELTGPAAGHDLLKTEADPTGTRTLGTWNNCGNGETPWGTYLTCEENFNGYFSAADEAHEVPAELKRYGVSAKDWGYGWARVDPRFDVAQNPNEPNRAGYVVEIDPFDPEAMPKKRTALGRFKHENAACTIAANGRVVVYLGDDERGEFLYRFVSDGVFSATGDNGDLLDAGTLYVAKFSDEMTGEWVPLTPEATGMTAPEIAIHTRQAGSAVGATTMDRPEWVAVNPARVEAFVALTNNKNRGVKPNAGGDETPVNGPNPREKNDYGQILRIVPDAEDHSADSFTWSLFALAGNPEVHQDAYAGSDNVNAGNMFNSPDGMSFDSTGLLWIQTDGNYSNEGDFAGHGNNQMLAGDTATGEIRRFLVGPRECEVTGMCFSPDKRTMFVGIQHPGEDGGSTFPNGGVPRSGVFAVTRTDGGLIG
ncbi:transcriptional initiation protein Tat [Oceanicola sp. 22II-s10i]|uniref:PhoX family protein n=1 Tax=Oceanicola sp. 22II-s10i TaxID=1317116 RepID=UPI000B527C9B|nr:PhoX family phosphatase [Oceanicola sp. 22II-s10i]OWU83292.1 transcriptional initiation protein Tat [Oceanicola sp. 22II-s10i]